MSGSIVCLVWNLLVPVATTQSCSHRNQQVPDEAGVFANAHKRKRGGAFPVNPKVVQELLTPRGANIPKVFLEYS